MVNYKPSYLEHSVCKSAFVVSVFKSNLFVIIMFLCKVQMQELPHQCPPPPPPGSWIAACIADLTPDCQVLQSLWSTTVSSHSCRSFCSSLRKHVHAIYCDISRLKNDNFQVKNCDIFLIFARNIDCGYTLEPPQ